MARTLLVLLLVCTLAACAPSVAPLYRDYEDRADEPASPGGGMADADVLARVRRALAAAGWTEAPSNAPAVVTTAPRRVSDIGLYRTDVALDVSPLGGRFVRVLFHPMRHYVTGGRAKVFYLDGGLRRALMPDLNEAFEREGLVPLGTPRERDNLD